MKRPVSAELARLSGPAIKPTADGWPRPADEERRLNMACAQVAETEPGRVMLDWLSSITAEAVVAPTASDAELRQMEGMRQLYAIICARIQRGETGDA